MKEFSKPSTLMTGAIGLLGQALISNSLQNSDASRIVILSREKIKKQEMKGFFYNNARYRWFLGDIRSLTRLKRTFHGVDIENEIAT